MQAYVMAVCRPSPTSFLEIIINQKLMQRISWNFVGILISACRWSLMRGQVILNLSIYLKMPETIRDRLKQSKFVTHSGFLNAKLHNFEVFDPIICFHDSHNHFIFFSHFVYNNIFLFHWKSRIFYFCISPPWPWILKGWLLSNISYMLKLFLFSECKFIVKIMNFRDVI